MATVQNPLSPSVTRMITNTGESQFIGLSDRLARLKSQITALKQRIDGLRLAKEADIDWENYGRDPDVQFAFAIRRQLKGHYGKVYDCDWAGDDTTVLSASQDGKLIVWNGFTENKREVVSLASAWVMCCAFEKEGNNLVASGGLDNTCTLHSLKDLAHGPTATLAGHGGFLSDAVFTEAGARVFTASGDGTCACWDVASQTRVSTFAEHGGDVMSLSLHPFDPHIFASAGCDSSVRVWDDRAAGGRSVRVFHGHVSDVNCVDFLSSGNAVGSGSDDATCRLFDLRSAGPVNVFADSRIVCGVTDVSFSSTGRLLFASYEEPVVVGWETTVRDGTYHELKGHRSRVSAVAVNAAGEALLSGSWDKELAVWA